MVDAEGENAIAVTSGANQELDPDMVQAAIASIPSAEAVVLPCLEVPDGAVLAAAVRGWPFVLDPAPTRPLPPELLGRCAVLTPNHHEAAALGPSSVQELLASGVEGVVVTRGAHRHNASPSPIALPWCCPGRIAGAKHLSRREARMR